MKILLTIVLAIIVFIFPSISYASYFLQPAQPAGNLVLNKTVRNPQSGQFVDNLFNNDPHFLPEQEVTYRIEIRNNTQSELNNIQVQDKLPNELNFLVGPGNFDPNTRTLTFAVDRLASGETKSFEIKGKVKPANELTAVPLNCEVKNTATAVIGKAPAQDTSLICIETKVLGVVQELPKTGPGNTLVWIGSFLMLFMSLIFLKKSHLKN